jgi:hypothetical protein
MDSYIPIIVALVSAIALVSGYAYQKKKERDFEISKTRKEIYKRLIRNLSERFMMHRTIRKEENLKERLTDNEALKFIEMTYEKYPGLTANLKDYNEIMALLYVYGTDDAIKACYDFHMDNIKSIRDPDVTADPEKLIIRLRKSLFKRTKVTEEDIIYPLNP